MQQNNDGFRLISPARETQTHMIEFKTLALYIKKVEVSNSVFLGQEQQIQTTPASYLLRGVETKLRSIPQGSLNCCMKNLYDERILSKLTVVLMPTENFEGSWKKDSYRFRHFDLTDSMLTMDGVQREEHYDFGNNLSRKAHFAFWNS